MIKNFEKARLVQERRYKARKRGYSKAVRRFVQRNTDNWEEYRAFMQGLPARWPLTPEEQAAIAKANEEAETARIEAMNLAKAHV